MTITYRFVASLAVAVAGLLLGVPAYAGSVAPIFIPISEVADAPSGFVEMCARDAALCMAGHGNALAQPRESDSILPRAEAVRLTYGSNHGIALAPDQELHLIKAINTEVNRAIRPMADYLTAGTNERWSRPGRGNYLVGDCEDYAIEKRMRLIENGFSPAKLFFSAAYIKGYGMHIVLIARLQSGDMVLDSLSPHVMPWSKLRYSWLRVQSSDNPNIWHRFSNQAAGKLASAKASGSRL